MLTECEVVTIYAFSIPKKDITGIEETQDGDFVTLVADITGSWINSYVYIDSDNDGFTAKTDKGMHKANMSTMLFTLFMVAI